MSVHPAMEQLQMPILVSVSGLSIPTRFDALELEMIERVKERSGLSKSSIIRRAVRLARLEAALRGSAEFLLGGSVRAARVHTTGRKPRAVKISELEKSISDHLRAAEQQRRQLEQLRQREGMAA